MSVTPPFRDSQHYDVEYAFKILKWFTLVGSFCKSYLTAMKNILQGNLSSYGMRKMLSFFCRKHLTLSISLQTKSLFANGASQLIEIN